MTIKDELARVEKEKAEKAKRAAELQESRRLELEKDKKDLLNVVEKSLQELKELGFEQEKSEKEDVFSCKKGNIIVRFDVQYYSTHVRFSDDTDPVPMRGYQCGLIVHNGSKQYDKILFADGDFDKTIAEFLGRF